MKKSAHEAPLESPVPFRAGSNGEFAPALPTAKDRLAESTFARMAEQKARKLGMTRRAFVSSTMGTATALCVINQVYGCSTEGAETPTPGGSGGTGAGGFEVGGEMTMDPDACVPLRGDEFIFDVQTHHVNPEGAWREGGGFEVALRGFPQSGCGETDFVDCFDADRYIREVFVNSDTAIAALSQVPAVPGNSPLEHEEAVVTREIVNRLADSERLLIHGIVVPDRGEEQLDAMQALVEDQRIAAWKVYTQFGGWRLDDESIGIPFIERARSLGVKLICAHKGLSLFGLGPEASAADDVARVAPAYPDVSFLVYHSGYEPTVGEGPYDPASSQGIDVLVRAAIEQGGLDNVYAELGSTWRLLMTQPTQAAHVLGKLLKYVGEDRVLWGTDSIWYGSPQDQIAAFRTFQIPESMQEEFGYPAITPEARAKILGLNAARVYGIDVEARRCAIQGDDLALAKKAIEAEPNLARASERRNGPQTRREFLRYLEQHEGRPG